MEDLDESPVLRAGQRPALTAAVPLSIFMAELMIGLLLFRFIEFWAVVFLPVHLYFVIKTDSDLHWITALKAWYNYRFTAVNKGFRGKNVVSFSANPIKSSKNDYADLI